MNKELRTILVVVCVFLGLMIIGSLWGGFTGFGGMMGNGFNWGFMGVFGVLFMIAFWALVIWGIVAFVRWLSTNSGGGAFPHFQGTSALEILKQRYARGEINKEEFEQKKKDLGG